MLLGASPRAAIFLLRAYRTTLPRFGFSEPLRTERMQVRRRISATYKDLPGGQLLGPTFDYTHRLLDMSLSEDGQTGCAPAIEREIDEETGAMPRVVDLLNTEGLIEEEAPRDEQEVGGCARRDASQVGVDSERRGRVHAGSA